MIKKSFQTPDISSHFRSFKTQWFSGFQSPLEKKILLFVCCVVIVELNHVFLNFEMPGTLKQSGGEVFYVGSWTPNKTTFL